MAWSVDEVRTYSYNGTNGIDGSVQNETLDPGTYKLECWGAQGGINDTSKNFGGYVVGEIEVTESKSISIYVGGCPGGSTSGGWPNGGIGHYSGYGTGGGGSSDIRMDGTALTDRIIVGAGGGGAGTGSRDGGHGGGLVGGEDDNYATWGTGGTQTEGGVANGAFGVGGNRAGSYACGGGGGWYGGGGGLSNFTSGGGGSSYYGTLANASTTTGVKTSHGEVKITMISGGGTPTTPKRRFAQII